MKKNFVILTILSLLFFVKEAQAATITVCSSCSVKTITKAIALAKNGDIIRVKPGIYKEGNIIVNKSVQLIGEGNPVVDGENKTEILTIISDNVTVSGFTIQNVGISYTEDRAGIRVVESKNCIIENNKLIDTFFGIYLKKASSCLIRSNIVQGTAKAEGSSGNAIHLWYSDSTDILYNKLSGHRDGIYLEFVKNSHISNNVSENNLRYGLHFMFSDNNEYLSNVFRQNGAGVAVMFSKNIHMIGNQFIKNEGSASYGLLLKDIKESRIENNLFQQNTIAVFAESTSKNVVKCNTFKSNGWAMKILGSCVENTITENNFFSNTFDITVNNDTGENQYNGNYWSDYKGYDLNKDGVGDVPYRPVKLYAYLVEKMPNSIILLRSMFVDMLNMAERVAPSLTPELLMDEKPLIKPLALNHDTNKSTQ